MQSLTRTAATAAPRQVRCFAAGKDIKFGVEGRAAMLEGVQQLADAGADLVAIHARYRVNLVGRSGPGARGAGGPGGQGDGSLICT